MPNEPGALPVTAYFLLIQIAFWWTACVIGGKTAGHTREEFIRSIGRPQNAPFKLTREVVNILAKAIRIKTVSETTLTHARAHSSSMTSAEIAAANQRFLKVISGELVPNLKHFLAFHEHLRVSFPRVHNAPYVSRQVIAQASLLYHIRGEDADAKPFLLLSHLDVVPASRSEWSFDPFSGKVDDEYIYGRGALDIKCSVVGIFQALEFLLESGKVPKRSFYIALGHDEENGGKRGAKVVAEHLKSEGIEFEFLLDEGTFVVDWTPFHGVKGPIAVIGTAEKGFASVELDVYGNSGHSSVPPEETTIDILAKAITRLQANPQPNHFGQGPEGDMFVNLIPRAPWAVGLVMKLVSLDFRKLGSLYTRLLGKTDELNALSRTTYAATMFNAGTKGNVLPSQAMAIINHRIHPASSIEETLTHDREVIDDDRVNMYIWAKRNPPPVASHTSVAYKIIAETTKEIFPGATVTPGVEMGSTDSKHYIELVENAYRFCALYLTTTDAYMIHGADEKISLDNFERHINFFIKLLTKADQHRPRRGSSQQVRDVEDGIDSAANSTLH